MTPEEILITARGIAREYMDDDLSLTLRQIFYQFVARGLAPSSDKTYKRIGAVLTKARYEGQFPVEWIDDRGRTTEPGEFTQNDVDPAWAIHNMAGFIQRGPNTYLGRARWWRQPYHVSVWVEKEALGGIVGAAADKGDVSWMACKGYPSVSALREWLSATWLAMRGAQPFYADDSSYKTQSGACQKAIVLYLGDHDPDGLEIPKAAERGIRKLMKVTGWDFPLEFRRIALTTQQIKQYSPPPFPAKTSSARFAKYHRETGLTEAWELDALEPRVLRDLITSHVESLFDKGIFEANGARVRSARADMKATMQEPGFVEKVFEGAFAEYDRGIPEADELLQAQSRSYGTVFDDDGCPCEMHDDDDSYDDDSDDDDDAGDNEEDED